MTRRTSRAEYELAKTTCAARITMHMQRLNLTPMDIQTTTTNWVMQQKEQYALSMQDLYQYRSCRALPKRGKLDILAKVLECSMNDLVPPHLQSGRTVVARQINHRQKDFTNQVTPIDAGYARVQIDAIVPTDTAYTLANKIGRIHTVSMLRREGRSDEEIKELMDGPTPGPQIPAPTE